MTESPDHNLITWCRGARNCEADRKRLAGLLERLQQEKPGYSDGAHAAVLDELALYENRAFDAAWTQIGLVTELAAATIEGLRAKATLVAALTDGPYPLDGISRSLALDVCRFTPPPLAAQQSPEHDPASLMVH